MTHSLATVSSVAKSFGTPLIWRRKRGGTCKDAVIVSATTGVGRLQSIETDSGVTGLVFLVMSVSVVGVAGSREKRDLSSSLVSGLLLVSMTVILASLSSVMLTSVSLFSVMVVLVSLSDSLLISAQAMSIYSDLYL